MQNSASATVSRRSAPNWFATYRPVSRAYFGWAGTMDVPASSGVAAPQPDCAMSVFSSFAW